MTRTEAFVDAAFAFAVTLLVISFDRVPANVPELIEALKLLPAFAASFALVALFWHAHHAWSRRTGLDDLGSVFLSLLLVFLVLVWVFPLRILFGTAFLWFYELALPVAWHITDPEFELFRGYDDVRMMFAIYAVAWSSLGFVIAELYRHAWRRREELGLDLEERARVRGEIATWLCVPATGALSILATTLLREPAPWAAGAPGLVYFLMFLSGPIGALSERRARRRLSPAGCG